MKIVLVRDELRNDFCQSYSPRTVCGFCEETFAADIIVDIEPNAQLGARCFFCKREFVEGTPDS